MDCPNCGHRIDERTAFCTQCGVSIPEKRGRAKSVLKWGGIGCGGLLVLFAILVAVAAISVDVPSSQEGEMRPDGRVLGGAEFAQMNVAEYENWLREESGLSEEQISEKLKTFSQEQATAVAWQSRFATPEPREWTVKELAECNVREREDPNLMQDCEVALFLAQMDGAELLRDDDELRIYMENLSALQEVVDRSLKDRVISVDEAAFICSVIPQWENQVKAATDYVKSLDRGDTVAAEVDILRTNRFLDELRETCDTSSTQ